MVIKHKGFTLIELLVCITIMSLITVAILGNRATYSEELILRGEAYKVALYVRQAQVYSLGVRSDSGTFNSSYGIYMQSDWNNQLYFFTDKNENGLYDSTEEKEVFTLANNITIQTVCGDNGTSCWSGNFKTFILTFKRPESSAKIQFLTTAGDPTPDVSGPPAVIRLVSSSGLTASVTIEESGAVSVQ